MKKTLLSVALVFGFGLTQISAQVEQATTVAENSQKQSVIAKVISGFKESSRAMREINKENFAAEKEMSRMRHVAATEFANSDLEKVKMARGFKNKVKVIVANMKLSAKENAEKETERRNQIQSHESYKNLLAEQRAKREATTKRK